jgi:hypothetical protein
MNLTKTIAPKVLMADGKLCELVPEWRRERQYAAEAAGANE